MAQVRYDFTGSTVLIVGGTSGIGLAIAKGFAAAGANVVVGGLQASASGLSGDRIVVQDVDVTAEGGVDGLAAIALERFGGFDIAVNNAGTEGRSCPVHEARAEDFDRILGVNLKGMWHGMRCQIPHLQARGGGAIVNMGSSASVVSIANAAIYSASKHGVAGLTKAAALELARSNIRVNAVAPGPVDTGLLNRMLADVGLTADMVARMVPMARVARPEEIVGAVLFLASSEASFMTGHVMVVDGGLTVA